MARNGAEGDSSGSLHQAWLRFLAVPDSPERREFAADLRARYPGFREAVVADARSTARNRGERHRFTSTLDAWLQVLRLSIVTDAFLAIVFYRAKTACQKRRVPLVPRILHRLAMSSAAVSIGDPVVIAPGLCLPHGMVVIDGITTLGENVTLSPFVTIGLVAPEYVGPTIGDGVRIGTGAKVIGAIELGREARVGANSVVLDDVPAGATVVGTPARVVGTDAGSG
jgi:serine O-acetyltransferase